MKISYNWLRDYLPKDDIFSGIIETPQKIGNILTSVGLEVEDIQKYEQVNNGLESLFIGKVILCEKHPDADKLKLTTIDNGKGETLQIVCGAPNVAVGQKVIVAPVGATLYPIKGEPITIKKAKIRGAESHGMLCAEDEIGLGKSHEGIIVLPEDVKTGMPANEYYQLYSDYTLEIGLTPNRMDAMSHLGVAKDVCAYLSHHTKKEIKVIAPYKNGFKTDDNSQPVKVEIENAEDCARYSGISISGIKVGPSPAWLQNKLKSIALRPVNNIVDITNFILHETGQPLHAFDADKIKGKKIIVKKLMAGTSFISLDDKERKLSSDDIMICDGDSEPMCIAGVFGGLKSGVSEITTNLFLESAWFNPFSIRKSLLHHNLRTDAAIRFEKGVDISNTVNVLKRAALLIKEIAGGKISSEIIDVYPFPKKKTEIILSNHYLKKISGKNYHPDTVKNILKSLNFTIIREGIDEIQVEVPFSNPDISIPADIIEEIMRIDGLDNVEIPSMIKMSPAIDAGSNAALQREKVITWLNGNGFSEIFTNSITNSKYFDKETLDTTVKIINSLSEELNVMRPSMLPTGLECIAYNINRKNSNLLFLEFGKTYSKIEKEYKETENLALYFTGNINELNWNSPSKKIDIYFVKGICDSIFTLLGLNNSQYGITQNNELDDCITTSINGKNISISGSVNKLRLEQFSIKQPVFFVCINWQRLISLIEKKTISFEPIAKFPQVHRDLSILVGNKLAYQSVEDLVHSLRLSKLIDLRLFDVFENKKLGENKKSFAISLTFLDREKTLTDKEIDNMMNTIIDLLETKLNAEIRRNA
ncbi:MAG: phenylalanine--tRNA ligase subunit beta [Bacteroidota bacterium]|nr:phenylalanine--tRNA ligase subunit beta [Bacteroidota bacterium]